MTPPSSQPAQPEQTAEERARELLRTFAIYHRESDTFISRGRPTRNMMAGEPMLDVPAGELEVAQPILTRLVLASKVQALEEAARKGCEYCRNRTAIVISDTPVHDGEQWVHLRRADLQPWESCERPEIWDLLSLLRPEGAQP